MQVAETATDRRYRHLVVAAVAANMYLTSWTGPSEIAVAVEAVHGVHLGVHLEVHQAHQADHDAASAVAVKHVEHAIAAHGDADFVAVTAGASYAG